ncbi:hypothetical protein [Mesorhizobium sp.]|uniref:hypothetical protein n=1 Tax=Mesorhizobium sp. TaxID=1871066 RepID=UPI0025C15913|nr:hypothetical protein [Mesorhizobium sp.]
MPVFLSHQTTCQQIKRDLCRLVAFIAFCPAAFAVLHRVEDHLKDTVDLLIDLVPVDAFAFRSPQHLPDQIANGGRIIRPPRSADALPSIDRGS